MSLSLVINTAWISPEGKIFKKFRQTTLVHKGMYFTALIWVVRMNLWMSSKKLVYQLLSGHLEELRELWNSSKDVLPRQQTAHAQAEKKDQRIKIKGALTLLHTLKEKKTSANYGKCVCRHMLISILLVLVPVICL